MLCGSRKYPVKEPFVELLKGSLHTFLNAFTYPDRTCYPVASTNTKVSRDMLSHKEDCSDWDVKTVQFSVNWKLLCFHFQDFYNLVDVYLDAVFFPKCVEDFKTFQQEGWHYELNDPSEDISYKGNFYCIYSSWCSILSTSMGEMLDSCFFTKAFLHARGGIQWNERCLFAARQYSRTSYSAGKNPFVVYLPLVFFSPS